MTYADNFYIIVTMKYFDDKMKYFNFNKVEVGARFKVFREIIDKTPSQLAEELDTHESEIKNIEDGHTFPEIIYLHYLYKEYGLNINWLLGNIGDMFIKNDPRQLGTVYATKPLGKSGDSRLDLYVELLELMEIPAIRNAIMATLLEIKTLLKIQGREKNENSGG